MIQTVQGTEFIDENIEPNSTYVYKVSAYNVVGEGPSSAERSLHVEDDYIPSDNGADGESKFPYWILAVSIPIIVSITALVLFLLVRKKKEPEMEKDTIPATGTEEYPLAPDESIKDTFTPPPPENL